MDRRSFLTTATLASAAGAALVSSSATASAQDTAPDAASGPLPIKLSLKCGMADFGANLEEKFRILKDIGYDGVELDSPGGQNKAEALAASRATGLPIHGVVDSIHWNTRLSDPSAEVRAKGVEGLLTAIRESHQVGGSAVLLVPGRVDETATHEEAWQRSIPEIRKALPLAAELGVHVLIENVWNRMFYQEKGGNDQSADALVRYIDEIGSPWVGSYFDIGNHQRFAKPASWIRQLGRRIVKMDVKDWSIEKGWTKIGEGDLDWPAVRTALREIRYTGWATAEVEGGGPDACADILARMKKHLLGV